MTRIKLVLEYDGTGFVGWQHQKNGLSVQDSVVRAIFKYCGQEVDVVGAGRTDSGVHATGQVAHVDLVGEHSTFVLVNALNAHLRSLPLCVLRACEVPVKFHARFSAIQRSYLYRIINRRAPLVLDKNRAWFVPAPLDVAAMREGAKFLLGTHDFTSFRATACQAPSAIKTLERLGVNQAGDEITIRVEARSFLHNQVRIIVGSLAKVGKGEWSVNDLRRALEACDRRAGGPTAPPHGLYLTDVYYPPLGEF